MPTINYKKNFKEALKIMNQKKLGIIVILKKKYIEGLVTDGDLRRELKNYSKNEKLVRFMRTAPLVVNENMPASKALGIMNEKKITSLLVVSDKHFKERNKVLKGISNHKKNIVFFLWGKNAQKKRVFIDPNHHLILTTSHPSPLSVYRGFKGCKHFSIANNYLQKNHIKGIIW